MPHPTALYRFLTFFILVTGFAYSSNAQLSTLKLRVESYTPKQAFIDDISPVAPVFHNSTYNQTVYTILQFKELISPEERKNLSDNGIEILEYIPDRNYLVRVSRTVTAQILKKLKVEHIEILEPRIKIEPTLLQRDILQTGDETNFVEVRILAFPGISSEELLKLMENLGVKAELLKSPQEIMLKATITRDQLTLIANQPLVYYIEEYPGPDIPLGDETNIMTGTSFLQNSLPGIGKGLTGKGVVIGMGDNGGAGHHLDHFYKTLEASPSMVFHSTHVAGILAGAGLIDPRMKGRAPESPLIVSFFSDIIFSSAQYYQQFGMVLTNNSYGSNSQPCSSYGSYNAVSRIFDQFALNYPEITHVFAAGNQTSSNCAPYPPGYFSMFSGPQSAKNIITVGASDKINFANIYSKGPTYDGRIKPEITSVGVNAISTVPPNMYSTNSGTSMAAPQVTGSLALLVERYRQLNNGANPQSGLLKNIIVNATSDIGNTGPDFANGYGWLNARTAVEILDRGNYHSSSILQGQQQTRSINVGNNVSELKIMLSWMDAPGSLYVIKSLVNDLDITVTSPSGALIKPLILSPLSTLNTAIPGDDHTNNMEQIIIRDPVPGIYTISVTGYEISLGPQTYYVSYSMVEKGLKLLAPLKHDKLKQGETKLINWINPGANPIGYDIELSSDAGNSWQSLGSTSGSSNYFRFVVPQVASVTAQLRIRNRTSAETVTVDSITILPELNFNLTSPCAGMVDVIWSRLVGIDSVSVLMVESGAMKKIVSTSDTSFRVKGLSIDSTYWFSVQPYFNGINGERAIAKPIQAIGGNCSLPEFDGDIALISLLNPLSGRKKSSTERGQTEKVSIKIKNLDNNPTTDLIFVDTYLNNMLFSKDTITDPVAGFGELIFTTKKSIDLSTIGNYPLRIELTKNSDPDLSNNTVSANIRIVPNEPIFLPLTDDFEALKDTTYKYPSFFALEGKDNWDFTASNNTGFVNTRSSPTNKALLPGKLRLRPLTVMIDFIGTFNFSNYSTSDDIFFSGNTRNRLFLGQCWVRGSDTANWILLPFTETIPYAWGNHGNISRALKSDNQQFSNSFQIRFETGKSSVEIDRPDTTYYHDDIHFYKTVDDLKLANVVTNTSRFFVGDTAVITTMVTNNAGNPVNNAVVSISLGPLKISDTIDRINAYDTSMLEFRVPITSNIPEGPVRVGATVVLPTDTYQTNNEKETSITILPLNSTFPYYESFEQGEGLWSTIGFYGLENHWKDKTQSISANGSKSWYTNNVTSNFPDTRVSVVTSTGFDISNLPNAYLSFSTKRYLRKGRDSVRIQISTNSGRSWQNLNSNQSFNWYNSPGKTSFSDSDKVYWHSVSCKLPDTAKRIMLRLLSVRIDSFKAVVWLGNIGIDDIHIYSFNREIYSAGKSSSSGTIKLDTLQWNEMLVEDKLVASIKSKDTDAQPVNWQYFSSTKNVEIFNGQKLLNRKWVLQSSENLSKPVLIRLYFSDNDAELLRELNRCSGCADSVSAYHFNIYQFTGPTGNINSLKRDNPASRYRIINNSEFNLVPYGNGYFAEFEAVPNGEFYIQVPERFPDPKLDFSVIPNGSENLSILSTIEEEGQVEKFEIEKAVGDENFELGEFSVLKSFIAQNLRSYTDQDKIDNTGAAIYYRLKVIYKNGYVKYSPEQVVKFNVTNNIKIYPNPSKGIFTIQISQTAGERILLQLSNAKGQLLQTSSRNATGSLEELRLDLSKAIYPPGVYLLKIFNGTEMSTFKLVKQ